MCMGKFKINKMFAISHIYTYALERQKDREGDRERDCFVTREGAYGPEIIS